MKKQILSLFILAFFVFSLPACSSADDVRKDAVRIKTAAGEEMVFYVELAQTRAQQSQGLMNRPYLAEDAGMLFLFNDEGQRTFWMENTLIPLDILFLKKDGKITHIHHNAKPQSRDYITSGGPAMAVLEINGGLSDKFNIKVGDTVLSPFFRNTAIQE